MYRLYFSIRNLITVCLLCCVSFGVASADKLKDQLKKLSEFNEAYTALTQAVGPSVVEVITTRYGPTSQQSESAAWRLQRSTGSGVIINSQGHVITNAHVVVGGQRIRVLLPEWPPQVPRGRSVVKPRGKVVNAKLIGFDLEADLAVLDIEGDGYPFLDLANSETVRPGHLVFAFGSPMGLENSVTAGVISAVARQLTPESPMIYIQTDAAVNPGNSGGPLINSEGKVIGINSFILTRSGGSEGLNFAIPSNIVSAVYDLIIRHGYVRRGQIGVHAQTITAELSEGLGLPQRWGVIIADVYPDSPAERAKLQAGDIILTLNKKTMENARQFDVNLYRRAEGDAVMLALLRGTDTIDATVRVAERQRDPGWLTAHVTPENNLVARLGFLGLDLDIQLMQLFDALRIQHGVVVASPAFAPGYSKASIKPGDLIHAVNGVGIQNLQELRAASERLVPGDPVVLHIEREGRLQYVVLEAQ